MKRLTATAVFIAAMISMLYGGSISSSRQENGEIVLQSLSVADGKIVFRTETGGCTDRKSFRVNVKQVKDAAWRKKPHYRITIERVVPDYCKGFFIDGTLIEIDLEKEAGLKGDYTLTVTNMVYTRETVQEL